MIGTDDIGPVSGPVRERFERWYGFMSSEVSFSRPDSRIHGPDHCARVLLYGLLICERLGLDDDVTDAFCKAAVFHDSRRFDDMYDVGHGFRGADCYREHCDEHGEKVDGRVYLAIAYHDRDDADGEAAISASGDPSALTVYHVLKDADALDRFRLGPGMLDVSMLRTGPARGLADFARDLVSRTSCGVRPWTRSSWSTCRTTSSRGRLEPPRP